MTANAQYIRDGFRAVTPYLIVHDAPGLIDFMVQVLDAEEIRRDLRPDGAIMNAEVRIGDSVVELAEAGDDWPPRPGALHVYLRDTDATYRRALAANATSLYEPADMPYGERSAGVQDPSGNHWYFATYTGQMAE
jgi:PhnB protein